MKKLSASKFERECLTILDILKPEGVVIAKRGRPVARVIPMSRIARS
jgi:antitoxin (DNA-binding transcriptional repressor) of toxin-antitoxin stability system